MRPPSLVLICLASVVVGLTIAAVAGALTERAGAIVLLALGITLIVLRDEIVAWVYSAGEKAPWLRHWLPLRPLGVTVAGSVLALLALLTFLDAAA
jgi:hypothetical protein